ncbi:hypothetical protein Sango_1921000 [Sesamum angolense]|uniref:Retrotransposon gag domain-containing protein n=1 Tax=Sesamum angolense TaxID=2727404 RepID=A0AAE1WDM9_9LAMI|nr:hypothetical protein Sango_1921000 [Sesamum angolense]
MKRAMKRTERAMMRNEIDDRLSWGFMYVMKGEVKLMEKNTISPSGVDLEVSAYRGLGPNPTFSQVGPRMAPQPQPQPQDAVTDKNYEVVRRQGAKVFAGTIDPAEAEEWLRNTKRVLDRIECTSEQKLRYAVSLFEKDALDWWETISVSKNRPISLTRNDFLKEFADKYTPSVYRNQEVSTDELKRDRFERGLRLEIQEKIEIKPPQYGALLEAALRAKEPSLERSST